MPHVTRIMVFGTFDILHPGHLNFFKQARALSKNSYLIVSIARDENVRIIKKSLPQTKERARMRALRKIKGVDKVVLGAKVNYVGHIKSEKPDIIALGYDQEAYTKNLRVLLKAAGLKVKIRRLKPFKPKKYKSSLFKGKVV